MCSECNCKDKHKNDGKPNVSLRKLVDENKEAMHKVASRLGDVNSLRSEIDAFSTPFLETKKKLESFAQTYKSFSDSVATSLFNLDNRMEGVSSSAGITNELLNKEIKQATKLTQRFHYFIVVTLIGLLGIGGGLFYQLHSLSLKVEQLSSHDSVPAEVLPKAEVSLSDLEQPGDKIQHKVKSKAK